MHITGFDTRMKTRIHPTLNRRPPAADAVAMADFATHLQRIREQERGELARELHDELGALLTCAKLDVAGLKSRLAGSSSDIDQRLQHLGEMINNGIAFSRRVVEGLHPSALENLGLTASLDILAREFGKNSGIQMSVELDEVHLDEVARLAVYRLVQEALNNASKYAGAHRIRVALIDRGADIVVGVQDDGKGFDPAATGAAGHGLAGMRHRVQACAGRLTLTSAPGEGTLVTAVLPKQANTIAIPVLAPHRATARLKADEARDCNRRGRGF